MVSLNELTDKIAKETGKRNSKLLFQLESGTYGVAEKLAQRLYPGSNIVTLNPVDERVDIPVQVDVIIFHEFLKARLSFIDVVVRHIARRDNIALLADTNKWELKYAREKTYPVLGIFDHIYDNVTN